MGLEQRGQRLLGRAEPFDAADLGHVPQGALAAAAAAAAAAATAAA